jgi:hypothetical protein
LVKMMKGLPGIPPDTMRDKRKNISWREGQVELFWHLDQEPQTQTTNSETYDRLQVTLSPKGST